MLHRAAFELLVFTQRWIIEPGLLKDLAIWRRSKQFYWLLGVHQNHALLRTLDYVEIYATILQRSSSWKRYRRVHGQLSDGSESRPYQDPNSRKANHEVPDWGLRQVPYGWVANFAQERLVDPGYRFQMRLVRCLIKFIKLTVIKSTSDLIFDNIFNNIFNLLILSEFDCWFQSFAAFLCFDFDFAH